MIAFYSLFGGEGCVTPLLLTRRLNPWPHQAKRFSPGHPGLLSSKGLEELGHTAASKLNDTMGVSCAETYTPHPRTRAVDALNVQAGV